MSIKYNYYRIIFFAVCCFLAPVVAVLAQNVPDPVKIAVLDFELNDLTLDPRTPEEVERTAMIKPLLTQELAQQPGYRIVEIDPSVQNRANKGFGYLFQHADAAAELGRGAGADWIVVGRVHKASFLFVYLKVHLINSSINSNNDSNNKQLGEELVVEVKGPQKRLTIRGVESLAEQIVKAIESSGQT